MDRRPRFPVFCIIGLLSLASAAACAAERERSLLEAEPELSMPVTFTDSKIPLGELVQRIAAQTGVRLVALPDVADEPVAVVVKAMPARALLEYLARLLDYQWTRRHRPRPPTPTPTRERSDNTEWQYEIYQDVASKEREEALRERTAAEIEKRFRERVALTIKTAALPPEEIRRLKEEEEQLRKERKLLTLEHGPAWQLVEPAPRAMAQLVGRLTPAHWTLLRRGDPLVFDTEPGPGELPLPEEMAQVFRKVRPGVETGMSYPPEIEEGQRQARIMAANEWAAAHGFRVVLQMKWDSFPGSLSLRASAQPSRRVELPPHNPARPSLITGAGSFYYGDVTGTRLFISTPVAAVGAGGAVDTAQQDPDIVTDPVFGVRKSFKPDPKPRPNHLGLVPRFRLPKMLRDLMPDLARTYGVQFIADAYRITGRAGGPPVPQPAPLYAMLDRLAWSNDRWERDGNVVLVRSRTWFLDRPQEIPLRFVRQWMKSCDEYGLLSLEEWIEAANALTDLQLEHIGQVATEADISMALTSPWPYATGPVLRLYGALTLAQQQALWQGRSLPVARMSPEQRALFAKAVRSSLRDWPVPIDMTRLAAGRLALHREDKISTVRPNTRGGASFSYESPPAAGEKDRPPSPRKRVTMKGGASRFPLTTLTFQLFFGPEWPAGTFLTVRPPS
jgi:hypothetical protein